MVIDKGVHFYVFPRSHKLLKQWPLRRDQSQQDVAKIGFIHPPQPAEALIDIYIHIYIYIYNGDNFALSLNFKIFLYAILLLSLRPLINIFYFRKFQLTSRVKLIIFK